MSYAGEIGRIGEQMVADYLKTQDYIIFAQNFRSNFGEIDIVAENRELLAFVEVKTRAKDSLVDPADAVDRIKQSKIIKTAYEFRRKAHHLGGYRFDVAEVTYRKDENGETKFSLNYIINAFFGDLERD